MFCVGLYLVIPLLTATSLVHMKRFFPNSNDLKIMPAKFITVDSIDALNAFSKNRIAAAVVLFKHSNTCGIDADIIDQVGNVDADVNVIVVQQHRDVSNEVAARTGYRHHSPQAFVIRDGKAVYHATHYGITANGIEAELRS